VQAPNPRTPSLLDLQHTSTHTYDFEISLKSFRSWLVDLCSN